MADPRSSPRITPLRIGRRGLITAVSTVGLLIGASEVAAQTCPLSPRPLFAGHTLPLDSTPSPGSMTLERAFPALQFESPVGFEAPPDASDRIFVVEQVGRIQVFENRDDVASASLFLDISELVRFEGEQGLLGLAFDPDYSLNRRFYVNYVARSGCDSGATRCTRIVRYETSPSDPDLADAASAFELLEFDQPYANHNGGAIEFGPDGMLYVASGDGGGGGDPLEQGQDISTPLGAILRLDVREGASTIVPADNPFVDDPQADPLVYHYGLRNPWRMTFDRASGDLFIADVGQNRREEVNRVPAGQPGGLNFGWNACEGTRDFDASCASISSVPPVIEYEHGSAEGGRTVIGGYVYRGSALPELYGSYVYSDASSMNIWAWDGTPAADPWNPGNPGVLISNPGVDLSSWGEDDEGELYAVSISTGFAYRLVRNGAGSGFPLLLSQTGFFSDVATLTASEGMIEYQPASQLWSDSAQKRRWIALPGDRKIVFHADDAWRFPIGSAFVKHFALPLSGGGERFLETRVLLRQTDRWLGVTYKWNAAQTDAVLQTTSVEESIDLGGGFNQIWRFPGSNDCLTCHTAAAGRVLGVRTRQLGEVIAYPPRGAYGGGEEIQLEAWNCAGLFDIDIREPSRYARARSIMDGTATRETRVRSYVATNCEHCHQPLGTAPGSLDLRFTTAIGEWNAIGAPVEQGDFGASDPRLLAPGDRDRSMLWLRQTMSDAATRMARGTLGLDASAVALIGEWIELDLVGFVDSDEDSFGDAVDVCPATPDPAQADRDQDGVGDVCDPDDMPDLGIVWGGTSGGTVFPVDSTIYFAGSVRNSGRLPAEGFPLSFYLSSDRTFDPEVDLAIAQCWIEPLGAGEQAYCVTSRTVTSELVGEADVYYSVVCANLAEIVAEADGPGECLVAGSTVLIPEPSSALLRTFGAVALVALARRRRRPAR